MMMKRFRGFISSTALELSSEEVNRSNAQSLSAVSSGVSVAELCHVGSEALTQSHFGSALQDGAERVTRPCVLSHH